MQPAAWGHVSISWQWNTEPYQPLAMNWKIGWDAAVTVSEVWTVPQPFLLFLTVNQKEVLNSLFPLLLWDGWGGEQGRIVE